MRAYERLIEYVQKDTASRGENAACPSTESQREFGEARAAELAALGCENARIDENGYVYAKIPASKPGLPRIGLIAHMDTVDNVPSRGVRPRVIEYSGGVIEYENGLKADPAVFSDMNRYVGQHLIITDGRTLLGADDKAGVAEIMTAAEYLIAHPELSHGDVLIGFTPDEEIGRGADKFDVAGFGADFAYTVDGEALGELNYENFNAASAYVEVKGVSIHPGYAKNRMRNAALVAMEFNAMLPPAETPAHTEGYEGFYHLTGIQAGEERAVLSYILRDHDLNRLQARKARLCAIAEYLNGAYGEGVVTVRIDDGYRNMREIMKDRMDIVRRAERAYRAVGITPIISPVRGGTDGATLSYMGLPCPNLGTGGANCHGVFEMISVEAMDQVTEALVRLVCE